MLDKLELNIFNKECTFVKGVGFLSQIPQESIPEFAFWGRSNVGKSSLVNTLVNRKNLVRVSKTPGRTKEINYFTIKDHFYLVDLPGYGYAAVAKSLKFQWNKLVVGFIQQSYNLKRIFLLIDAKVGFKELDFTIMDFLNKVGKSYQIVFTKADKIKKVELEILLDNMQNNIIPKNPAMYPVPIITSSRNKEGLQNIKQVIIDLV